MRFYCLSCEKSIITVEIQFDFILDRFYIEAKCHGEVNKFHIPRFEFQQEGKTKVYNLFPKPAKTYSHLQMQKLEKMRGP